MFSLRCILLLALLSCAACDKSDNLVLLNTVKYPILEEPLENVYILNEEITKDLEHKNQIEAELIEIEQELTKLS